MPLSKDCMLFGFTETLTEEQQEYVDSMKDNQLTICNAPAGTGKTTLAVAMAKISGKKLVYIFSPVEEGAMGFRPGSQKEKELDYLGPLYSALIECGDNPTQVIYDENNPASIKNDKAWVYPRSHVFARGCNIKDRFVIIDEAQNYTKQQLKKVLTRIHDDCTVVLIGHSGQCDLPDPSMNGFDPYIKLFSSKDYCKVIRLTKNFRGILAQDADSLS